MKKILIIVFMSLCFLFKYGFGGFPEVSGNLECQDCGGNIPSSFDGIDGLPAHAYSGGQILLGDVFDCPFNFDSILHRASLLM